MQSKIDLFSQLLRELEAEIGMNDLDTLVLKKLIISIKAFKTDSVKDFFGQYQKLQSILFNTEPKYGILRYQLGELNKFLIDLVNKKNTKFVRINEATKITNETQLKNSLYFCS